eukprot:COSAG02_NODE_29307_length_571_cov_9.298729_1_plen_49_part_01
MSAHCPRNRRLLRSEYQPSETIRTEAGRAAYKRAAGTRTTPAADKSIAT